MAPTPIGEAASAPVGVAISIHERRLPAPIDEVGALIDGLASPRDRLWPRDAWPSMHLESGLRVGSAGGHGPIRYEVEVYEPGRRARFRFTSPRGLVGFHEFRAAESGGQTVLSHHLEVKPGGLTALTWPLVYRPLHDALIEDALDRAESALGTGAGRRASWPMRVRVLRRLFGRPAIRRPR